MSKITKALLAAMMILSLGACSSNGGGTSTTNTAASTPEATAEATTAPVASGDVKLYDYANTTSLKGKTIGFINASADDLYAQYYAVSEYFIEQAGGKVVYAISNGNDQTELDNVQNMINTGVDAIILITVGANTGTQSVKLCNEAGVPVFLCGQPITAEDGVKQQTLVSVYHFGIGKSVGEYAAKTYPDDVVVMIDGSEASAASANFGKGFQTAFEEAGLPIPESVGFGNWSKTGGLEVCENLIASGREFDAIYCANEEIVAGVQQALAEAGITGKRIYSINGKDAAMEWLKEGTLTATIGNPPTTTGELLVQAVLWYFGEGGLNPADLPDEIQWVSTTVLTKDNTENQTPWGLDAYLERRAANLIDYSIFDYIKK